MKILIVGGGGREHALAWKAARCERVERVYVAPGNAGTAAEPRTQNVAIDAEDIDALVRFAALEAIDLAIIGPEKPLVMGVVDAFAQRGLNCFGPVRAAARLEGSKTFAKDFITRHAIPTAAHRSFTDAEAALGHLDGVEYPVVIKADGLAAGKGVIIAATRRAAAAAITDMLTQNRYGEAGSRVLIEEFLEGEEASFICMVDGQSILPLASSQDHKAAHDGDTGPNTGGMGAYSPAPLVDAAMHRRIIETIIRPTVAGMAAEGMRYTGFLYAGLMIGADGVPKVLEFNCRLGDPETQPIMLRLRSDLVAHCLAAVRGTLADERAQWSRECALGVVMAAAGYPGQHATGSPIEGLDGDGAGRDSGGRDSDGLDSNDQDHPTQKVFHSGTAVVDGRIIATGGRVLCATATGNTVRAARHAAYQLVEKITYPGCWYRTDIGHHAIHRETTKST